MFIFALTVIKHNTFQCFINWSLDKTKDCYNYEIASRTHPTPTAKMGEASRTGQVSLSLSFLQFLLFPGVQKRTETPQSI